MKRLAIEASKLSTEGFRLDLAVGDDSRVITLGSSGALSGGYEQDDAAIRLRSISADVLAVEEVEWRAGGARFSLTRAGSLRDIFVDGAIAVGAGADSDFTLRVNQATVDLLVEFGAFEIRLHGVELSGFSLRIVPRAGYRLEIDELRVANVEVRQNKVDIRMAASEASGIVVAPQEVAARSLAVGDVEVSSPVERAEAIASAKDIPPTAMGAPLAPKNLGQLLAVFDHLHGRVHADVVTDVTVPILGQRRATHRFRVPISHGVLDFRALENNLAFLEDLVIHLKKRKRRLVLEKKLPLIPFEGKPLVYWSLDDEAEALAEDDRVRLRTLMRPEIPPERREEAVRDIEKRGRSVVLRQLEIGDIDVDLRFEGGIALPLLGGQLHVGAGVSEEPTDIALRLGGEVRHVESGPDGPGSLIAEVERLRLAANALTLAGWRFDISSLHIAKASPVVVEFSGLVPTMVRATLSAVVAVSPRIRGVDDAE